VRRSLASLLLIAACTCSKPQDELVIRVAVVGPLAPLHPLVDSTATTLAQDLVYQPMLTVDDRGSLTSRVAGRWERVDGKRYRFQLDPALRFSDGSAVRDEDAVASLSARGLRAAVRDGWIEAEQGGSGLAIEPSLIYSVLFRQAPNGYLGTGPFRLSEQTETRIVLERVKPIRGRINRVELLSFLTHREVIVAVLHGEANAAFALDERQLVLLEDLPNLRLVHGASPHAVTVVFNSRRLDAATRQRLRAALPLRYLAEAFGKNCQADAAVRNGQGSVPPGARLEVLVPELSTPLYRTALATRRGLWIRGGEVAQLDMLKMKSREETGDFDILVRPVLAWPSPFLALSWQTGGPFNYSHYSNLRVDAAFASGDFAAARAELEADAAFLEICRRESVGVVDARAKNPSIGLGGLLDTLPDWEVEE
jgi:hypothetical protein